MILENNLTAMLAALVTLAAANPALAETPAVCPPGEMCVCTGSPTGNYQVAGEAIAKHLGADNPVKVHFVNTNGSLDNLNMVARGQCSAGITQSDVFDLWRTEAPDANKVEVLADLYTEYFHILCPTSAGISNLSDLASKHATLIIGPPGSGTAETWRSARSVDEKKYGNANVDVSSDPIDAGSIQAVKASRGKAHPVCMEWISGLNSTAMQNANDRSWDPATGKPVLTLISVDDKRIAALPGRDGPRYTIRTIYPAAPDKDKKTPGFYNNLINNGGVFSSSSVDVLSVPAQFIINKDFKAAMPRKSFGVLTTAIDDASGGLRKVMSPGE